ncbi:hypothetical protein SCB71_16000 [Herbiconiux sp. KACC 21604]|uniref:hypothetical protein n=1 Tax=unclassified Herbiconiux TaxID=2618217 RepID=UPI00149155FB|nr:hypothetical protein [Herbiconiux sp. SALV-R1]QJU54619.1 hypothetical protein HL652_13950 [Herbiconiux sp. SALV-R1]WPO85709.1 hypothetical protein SCB71_16000 [Herbiconiux sp. KACC 21604]
MSTSKWTEQALRARLRADVAVTAAGRHVSAADAARRLEYLRIVAGVDAGAISPDAGAALFDEMSIARG